MSSPDAEELDPRELLLQTHRREKKALQAQLQALKKSATKGDKKKKKELAEEMAKMEKDLLEKHEHELNELEAKAKADVDDDAEGKEDDAAKAETEQITASLAQASLNGHAPSVSATPLEEQRVSKAQKRRDKKAQKEKDRQAEIARQDLENETGQRQTEIAQIAHLLESRQLCLHTVPSDGDCMFAGLLHQLSLSGQNGAHSVATLRRQTAEEMAARPDDYLPFLSHPKTGDMLTGEQFAAYCRQMADTPAWGGQVELRALSRVLNSGIEVIQAEGPPMVVGEEFPDAQRLVLTYHRHMYGLGEHYNSTKPKETST